MKDTIQVSLIQFAPESGARDENVGRLVALVEQEAQAGADLVLFPELAAVGPLAGIEDPSAVAEPIPGPTTDALAAVARARGVHVLVGVLESGEGDALHSSAALIDPGGDVAVYRRLHLLPDERSVLTAGDEVGVFPTGLGTIAVSLSYDVSFPELSRVQALDGAEILATLWAVEEPPERMATDGVIVPCRSRATENFVYVLGCNSAGTQEPRTSRSAIVSCNGEVIAEAKAGREEVVRGEITDRAFREQRMYLTIFRDRRPELYGALIEGS